MVDRMLCTVDFTHRRPPPSRAQNSHETLLPTLSGNDVVKQSFRTYQHVRFLERDMWSNERWLGSRSPRTCGVYVFVWSASYALSRPLWTWNLFRLNVTPTELMSHLGKKSGSQLQVIHS
jgi:hypothetical protein